MSKTDRQQIIRGWNQERIASSTVCVLGRDWKSCFTVLGLRALGVQRVLWVGSTIAETELLTRWIMSQHGREIDNFEHDVDFSSSLDWLPIRPELLIECNWLPQRREFSLLYAQRNSLIWFDAFPSLQNLEMLSLASHMLLAAIAVDRVRMALSPLPTDIDCQTFWPNIWPLCEGDSQGKLIMIVGVGGIGTWLALLLAIRGFSLYLVDHDTVEITNLNRQLFEDGHALLGLSKIEAMSRVLQAIDSRVRVEVRQERVGTDFVTEVLAARPIAIMSAVDNAETRLVLQHIGRQTDVPVVQAGTGIGRADVFVQTNISPCLDAQMHGALSRAASEENAAASRGLCATQPSYVVSGMIAAAMQLQRLELLHSYECPVASPMSWRQGTFPS